VFVGEMEIAKSLKGKIAIVTASTQGIGFAIAERLGLEGASVVISSRRQVGMVAIFSFLFYLKQKPIIHLLQLNCRRKTLMLLLKNSEPKELMYLQLFAMSLMLNKGRI
jgi:hypothetical protein